MFNQNLTALLMQFANLSSKISMPPETGYGPIFWSDDFEQDFHQGVVNAQENYYDAVNHPVCQPDQGDSHVCRSYVIFRAVDKKSVKLMSDDRALRDGQLIVWKLRF